MLMEFLCQLFPDMALDKAVATHRGKSPFEHLINFFSRVYVLCVNMVRNILVKPDPCRQATLCRDQTGINPMLQAGTWLRGGRNITGDINSYANLVSKIFAYYQYQRKFIQRHKMRLADLQSQ